MRSFHKLEAARAGRFHPTVDVGDPVGKHTAGTREASADGRKVVGREMFDDHEKHERSVTYGEQGAFMWGASPRSKRYKR